MPGAPTWSNLELKHRGAMAQWWNTGVGVGLVLKDAIFFNLSPYWLKTKDDFSENPNVTEEKWTKSTICVDEFLGSQELVISIEKSRLPKGYCRNALKMGISCLHPRTTRCSHATLGCFLSIWKLSGAPSNPWKIIELILSRGWLLCYSMFWSRF